MPAAITRIATDTEIQSRPGGLWCAVLTAGAGAAASLKLTDDTDGGGTSKLLIRALTGTTASVIFPSLATFPNAIYATITGAGAEATIQCE